MPSNAQQTFTASSSIRKVGSLMACYLLVVCCWAAMASCSSMPVQVVKILPVFLDPSFSGGLAQQAFTNSRTQQYTERASPGAAASGQQGSETVRPES